MIMANHVMGQTPIGKIVDSYIEGSTTQMLIEVDRYLNTSQTVFLHGGIPIVVREVVSISERQGVHYYRAYSPEKLRALPGETVFAEPTSQSQKLRIFERKAIFMNKKHGTVTLIEDGKALINRGSLHNVDKRDIYKIYDKHGKSKGIMELYGIGDFLSAAHVYYPIEKGGKKAEIKEGDSVVFVGNRKIVGTGLMLILYQGDSKNLRAESGAVTYQAGGVLWSLILRKGRMIETWFGGVQKERFPPGIQRLDSNFSFPIWFRKAFYYPGILSPSVMVGLARSETIVQPLETQEELTKYGLAPILGFCLETFTGRMVHLRFDLQYYATPDRQYMGKNYDMNALFLIGGITINW